MTWSIRPASGRRRIPALDYRQTFDCLDVDVQLALAPAQLAGGFGTCCDLDVETGALPLQLMQAATQLVSLTVARVDAARERDRAAAALTPTIKRPTVRAGRTTARSGHRDK